jgi:HAD superfamily hydrolase (TIGR01509 family)
MRAVIFDMDGVLIDSEPLWRLAEQQIFADIGIELSNADCERTMGMRTDEVIEFWYRESPWKGPTTAEVEALLEERMRKLIAERGTVMAGVERSLEMARAEGLTLGLATSSSPPLIDAVLTTLGMEEAFAVTHSAVEEEFGKPHPAVFLTTARLLGVEPAECVAIEDSKAGVGSATAAGMRVIAVPPTHLFDDPAFDGADFKLRSLDKLTPEMLRSR